jgi:hypothetical protein
MKASPKYLLILALLGLVGGLFVASSDRNLPPTLDVFMPLGAIFTGLFLVSLLLKKEVVKFNEDQRLRKEAIKLYQSSACDPAKEYNEEDSSAPRTMNVVERNREIRCEGAVEVGRKAGDPS